MPGKPDIVLPRHRTVIFVHGCFWHRHPGCNVATTPKSNTSFWVDKFERNTMRDQRVIAELQALGWKVLVAWECELTAKRRLGPLVEGLAVEIRGAAPMA